MSEPQRGCSVLIGTSFMNEVFIVTGKGKERPKPNYGVVITHELSSVPHGFPIATELEGFMNWETANAHIPRPMKIKWLDQTFS